jgi:altronate dehydratase
MERKDVVGADGETVVLTQTGEYFDRIGMMVIDAETGDITTDFIELVEVTETTKDADGKDVTKWEIRTFPNPKGFEYWGETTVFEQKGKLIALIKTPNFNIHVHVCVFTIHFA